ncbi:MAG: TauD/TfdA family dioxygenase [Novosphingobium sp.]|nr:TauD/TfdA family dioxygenase [Novosphingobium sp.]
MTEEAIATLDQARQAFGEEVSLSEPVAGSPPLWIEPASDKMRSDIGALTGWMDGHHEEIEQALLGFGAIVWRGFPLAETDQFERMMGGFQPFALGYAGGTSDRKSIKGQVMEATRTPSDIYIQLHQEMSYMPSSPRALALWCRQPSETGGETVICDMRGVLEELPDALRRKITDCGVQYVRNMMSEDPDDWRSGPDFRHPNWQYRFETEDRDDVSSQLKERGASFEWHDDGSLSFWTSRPGTLTHPITGEELFFNQLNSQAQNRWTTSEEAAARMDAAYGETVRRPYTVRWGNGDPLLDEEFLAIRDLFERRKRAFAWRAGDVMLLENKLTGHGRHAFTGERDVQVMIFG